MAVDQLFKPIYFQDRSPGASRTKSLVLAFGDKHRALHKDIATLESAELRSALGTESYAELERRAAKEGLSVNTYCLWYLNKKRQENLLLKASSNPEKHKPLSHFLNQVIEGDCLDIMGKIPSGSIDMILCDLPYGTTQNHWDSIIPLDDLWMHYERIIKANGAIVLTGQGLFTATLMLSKPSLFKYKTTWVKSKPTNFLNAKKQPLRKHEDICVFYKKQPTYNPQMTEGEPYNKGFRKDQLTGSYGDFKTVEVKSDGKRYPTDVVYFKTAESEGETYHPTQKPVELGQYLIRTFTDEGAVVLDNACGSGSFLVSAVLENRRFIGIEKNKEVYLHKKKKTDYIQVSKKRIKKAEMMVKESTKNLL